MTQIENTWRYGQVKSNALNIRREPSRRARRWNNVWPMSRLVLVKFCGVDGWYETLYRGEPAYVMSEYFALVSFRQTWSKPISLFSVSSNSFQAPK